MTKKKKSSDPLKIIKDLIPKDLQKVIEERFVFSPDDIFKSVSIMGSAVLIKGGIDWTEDIFKKMLFPPQFGIPISFFTSIFQPPKAPTPVVTDTPRRELMEWVLSFTLAYLIVTNFGELIKASADIINMAKGMITGIGLK